MNDGVRQITIGLRVLGERLRQARKDSAQVKLVNTPEHVVSRGGHFKYHDLPSGNHNAPHLLEGLEPVRNISYAKGDSCDIEAVIREREGQGIASQKTYPFNNRLPLLNLEAGQIHHPHDKIEADDLDRRVMSSSGDRQVAGTGRHVQEAEGLEKIHLPDSEASPGDIPAKAEKVVEKVVSPGYCRKNFFDHSNAFGF